MKLVEQVKKTYEVIENTSFGGGESLIFKSSSSKFFFCLTVTSEESTIYRCFKDSSGDYQLLPNFKSAKTFKTIQKYVTAK